MSLYFLCLSCRPLTSVILLVALHSSCYLSLLFLFTSPYHSALLCLTSPLFFSSSFPLLPLFRLCKVQLGFGAFGPQAWRQEDALSEYALLGSLCVTLYFFALLFFTRRRRLLLLFPFTPVSVAVVLWVSSSSRGRPYPHITSVSAENWHPRIS